MKQDRQRIRRDFLMALHTIAFALIWMITFTNAGMGSFAFVQYALVWSLVYIAHLRGHLLYIKHAENNSPEIERKAYRDGFNDAVKALRENQETPERLMLNDDGELIEEPVTEKRKYR